MHVVFMTRRIDRRAAQWGFAHDWVETFSRHFDHLDVIAHEVGDHDLPAGVNLYSLGKEDGASRAAMLRRFWKILNERLPQADILMCHALPQYLNAAAPLALWYRVPMVQWYAFGLIDWELYLSTALSTRVISSTKDSFPIESRKLVVVGHGIDFERRFRLPEKPRPERPRTVISVGRIDPSKGIEEMIGIASQLCFEPGFEDLKFKWIGELSKQAPAGYMERVDGLLAQSGLGERFVLTGGLPFAEIVKEYQEASVMLSLSRTGSLDKVVTEAAGCGMPVLATGTVYYPLLDHDPQLTATEGNLDEVREKLTALLVRPQAERDAIGLRLRERSIDQNSLEQLASRLRTLYEEIKPRRKGR